MRIPAFCDSCGTAFPSPISVTNRVMALRLEGNKVSPCPKCNGEGSIPDGLFDFIDGAVRVLAGPQRAVDNLRTVALILEDARGGLISPEQALNRIEEIIPELPKALGTLLSNAKGTLPWITALAAVVSTIIMIVTLLNPDNPSTTINNNISVTNNNMTVTNEIHLSERDINEIVGKVLDGLAQPEDPIVPDEGE